MEPPHAQRRRIKHFDEHGQAHLLTFSCYQRLSLLANDTWRPWLSEAVDRATERHNFTLIAFVYMPEHVHLLVHPELQDYSVADLLYGIKKPFSERIKRDLEAAHSPWLEQLKARERPGKIVFRFWQKGPGHDRNLTSRENLFVVANYLHNNPVRRGLVPAPDRWKWSSWRFYHLPDLPPENGLPRIRRLPDG